MAGKQYRQDGRSTSRPHPGARTQAQAAAIAILVVGDLLASRVGVRPRSAAIRLGAAVAVLGIARTAGVSWAELGLGRDDLRSGVRTGAAAAACVAGTVLAGAVVPGTRSLFLDERAAADHDRGLAVRLASITLAAVPAEELAYRSALLGLWLGTGRRRAVAWSSVLFGLSHVSPTLSTMSQTAAGRHLAERPLRQAAFVGGNVAVTGLAGGAFAWLRLRSGSVLAPVLAHAALNDAALLAARAVHASAARRTEAI
jgi:uncharacterized protein